MLSIFLSCYITFYAGQNRYCPPVTRYSKSTVCEFCHCTPLLTAANVGFQRRFEQHIFELISNAILATMIHPYFKLRWRSTKSTEKYAHYCSKKRLSCSAKCAGPVYESWHRRWLFLHLLILMTQKHHNRQLMQRTSVTSKYCSLLKITGRTCWTVIQL